MELQELVNRDLRDVMSQGKCLFVIKEYIKTRKGVDVSPKIEVGQPSVFVYQELKLMNYMCNHAINWFRENGC